MKNQPNTFRALTNSPERLIRPLEPKRIPSVVPGLEGAATVAADDFHHEIDLAEEIPAASELPVPAVEFFDDSIFIYCSADIELAGENSEAVESYTPDVVDPDTFSAPAYELVDDRSEIPVDSEDEILTGIFEGEMPIDSGWSFHDCLARPCIDIVHMNRFTDIGSIKVISALIAVSCEDNSDEPESEDSSDWDLGEYENDLLNEYEAFLAENPDWIAETSGGDMNAEVITSSQYTGLELADPGAAHAFDLWFEQAYLNQDDYQGGDNEDWIENGSGGEIEIQFYDDPQEIKDSPLTGYEDILNGNPGEVAKTASDMKSFALIDADSSKVLTLEGQVFGYEKSQLNPMVNRQISLNSATIDLN